MTSIFLSPSPEKVERTITQEVPESFSESEVSEDNYEQCLLLIAGPMQLWYLHKSAQDQARPNSCMDGGGNMRRYSALLTFDNSLGVCVGGVTFLQYRDSWWLSRF